MQVEMVVGLQPVGWGVRAQRWHPPAPIRPPAPTPAGSRMTWRCCRLFSSHLHAPSMDASVSPRFQLTHCSFFITWRCWAGRRARSLSAQGGDGYGVGMNWESCSQGHPGAERAGNGVCHIPT